MSNSKKTPAWIKNGWKKPGPKQPHSANYVKAKDALHIKTGLRQPGQWVPNVTPGSRQMYLGLEKIAVEALKSLGYSTLAKADLETWKSYSNGFRQFFREGDSTPEMV